METDTAIANGESIAVEYKRRVNDRELVRAVVCLANAEGGILLVGIDEPKPRAKGAAGVVVGAAHRHEDHTDPARVSGFIQNNTDPPLTVDSRIEHINGHEILRVDVPRADPWPVATRDGYFSKRIIDATGTPACQPLSPQEIISGGMVTRGMDYAASPARGAQLDDLEPAEFERFRVLCRRAGDERIANLGDLDILRALGLVPKGDPVSLGAILLFGTQAAVNHWTPTAECLFQDLRGGERYTNDRYVGPLFAAAEWLGSRIDERQTTTELVSGLFRVELPLIPMSTRRESVANALVHRDYSVLGPTVVQLTATEFTVANPGGLPPGVTVANILEQSRPRSPILADAFKRAGLVDRRGKGVNDMFEQQLRAGRDVPDYSRTTSDSVTVGVPLGTSDLELVRFLIQFENDTHVTLGVDELRLVHEVHAQGSATAAELTEVVGLPQATTRAAAGHLVEKGILESRGNGRSRKYHLTARFYDLAQDRAAYVRVKGADPLQQERMILDYVTAYRSISRSQAAQLCQLAPAQARLVLKRLVDSGQLRLVGEKRGAHYIAATEGGIVGQL